MYDANVYQIRAQIKPGSLLVYYELHHRGMKYLCSTRSEVRSKARELKCRAIAWQNCKGDF